MKMISQLLCVTFVLASFSLAQPIIEDSAELEIVIDPVTRVPPCDPVGTLDDSFHVPLVETRCWCRPFFYGDRCHQIVKCRSGRPANITCGVEREGEHFAQAISARCIPGQELLEVCVCFPGYTGALCEDMERKRIGSFRVDRFDRFDRVDRPPVYHRPPVMIVGIKEHEEERISKERIETEETMYEERRISLPAYKVILFVIDLAIFVSILACCRWVWMRTLHRRKEAAHDARVYEEVPRFVQIRGGSVTRSNTIDDLPPCYEDAVRAQLLKSNKQTHGELSMVPILEQTLDGNEAENLTETNSSEVTHLSRLDSETSSAEKREPSQMSRIDETIVLPTASNSQDSTQLTSSSSAHGEALQNPTAVEVTANLNENADVLVKVKERRIYLHV